MPVLKPEDSRDSSPAHSPESPAKDSLSRLLVALWRLPSHTVRLYFSVSLGLDATVSEAENSTKASHSPELTAILKHPFGNTQPRRFNSLKSLLQKSHYVTLGRDASGKYVVRISTNEQQASCTVGKEAKGVADLPERSSLRKRCRNGLKNRGTKRPDQLGQAQSPRSPSNHEQDEGEKEHPERKSVRLNEEGEEMEDSRSEHMSENDRPSDKAGSARHTPDKVKVMVEEDGDSPGRGDGDETEYKVDKERKDGTASVPMSASPSASASRRQSLGPGEIAEPYSMSLTMNTQAQMQLQVAEFLGFDRDPVEKPSPVMDDRPKMEELVPSAQLHDVRELVSALRASKVADDVCDLHKWAIDMINAFASAEQVDAVMLGEFLELDRIGSRDIAQRVLAALATRVCAPPSAPFLDWPVHLAFLDKLAVAPATCIDTALVTQIIEHFGMKVAMALGAGNNHIDHFGKVSRLVRAEAEPALLANLKVLGSLVEAAAEATVVPVRVHPQLYRIIAKLSTHTRSSLSTEAEYIRLGLWQLSACKTRLPFVMRQLIAASPHGEPSWRMGDHVFTGGFSSVLSYLFAGDSQTALSAALSVYNYALLRLGPSLKPRHAHYFRLRILQWLVARERFVAAQQFVLLNRREMLAYPLFSNRVCGIMRDVVRAHPDELTQRAAGRFLLSMFIDYRVIGKARYVLLSTLANLAMDNVLHEDSRDEFRRLVDDYTTKATAKGGRDLRRLVRYAYRLKSGRRAAPLHALEKMLLANLPPCPSMRAKSHVGPATDGGRMLFLMCQRDRMDAVLGAMQRASLGNDPAATQDELFITPKCGTDPNYGGERRDADEELWSLLHDGPQRVVVLMGSIGSGKTTILRLLEKRLWEAWKLDRSCPIPIYIHVPSVREAYSRLAAEHLQRLGLSESSIDDWRSAKRVVFLLDGCDELHYPQHNLLAVNRLSQWRNAKFLVSADPDRLREASTPSGSISGPSASPSPPPGHGQTHPPDGQSDPRRLFALTPSSAHEVAVRWLAPWDELQVREYLERSGHEPEGQCGLEPDGPTGPKPEEGDPAHEDPGGGSMNRRKLMDLAKEAGVADMLRTPMRCKVAATVLPLSDWSNKKPRVLLVDLYEKYSERWLSKNGHKLIMLTPSDLATHDKVRRGQLQVVPLGKLSYVVSTDNVHPSIVHYLAAQQLYSTISSSTPVKQTCSALALPSLHPSVKGFLSDRAKQDMLFVTRLREIQAMANLIKPHRMLSVAAANASTILAGAMGS